MKGSSQYILISSFLREYWPYPEVLKTCQSLGRQESQPETAPPLNRGRAKADWLPKHIQTVIIKLLGNIAFANTLQWFWKVNLVEEKLLVGFWMVRGISTGLAWPVISWAYWCSQSWCKTNPANPSAELGEHSRGRASTGSSLFSHSCCCFGTSWQTELGQKGVLLVCVWVFI